MGKKTINEKYENVVFVLKEPGMPDFEISANDVINTDEEVFQSYFYINCATKRVLKINIDLNDKYQSYFDHFEKRGKKRLKEDGYELMMIMDYDGNRFWIEPFGVWSEDDEECKLVPIRKNLI